MPRRISTPILLILLLAGLYFWRVQLLFYGLNAILSDAGVRVESARGLAIGWRSLQLDQLALLQGDGDARQLFEAVRLDYSPFPLQLDKISIDRARLTVPAMDGPGKAAGDGGPASVVALVDRVLTLAPGRLIVREWQILNAGPAALQQPGFLEVSWGDRAAAIDIGSASLQLQARLTRAKPDLLSLSVHATVEERPLAWLDAQMEPVVAGYQLRGDGEVVLGEALSLVPQLAGYRAYLAEPDITLSFKGSGLFADDPAAAVPQTLQVSVQPLGQLALVTAALAPDLAEAGLRLEFAAPLEAEVTWTPSGTVVAELSGSALRMQYEEPGRNVELTAELPTFACSDLEQFSCQARFTANAAAPQLRLGESMPVSADRVRLLLQGELASDGDSLTVNLEPGRVMEARLASAGGLTAATPALLLESSGTVHYGIASGRADLALGRLRLLLPKVTGAELELATVLTLGELTLTRESGVPPVIRSTLATDSLNIRYRGDWLPPLRLDSNLGLVAGRGSLEARISGVSRTLATLSAAYILDRGSLTGRIRSGDLTFDGPGRRLSEYFAFWPYEFDLVAGQLSTDIRFDWSGESEGFEPGGTVVARVDRLAGSFRDIGFVGLGGAGEAAFSLPGSLRSIGNVTLGLDTLYVGLPVEKLRGSFSVDTDKGALDLESLEATFMSARLWAENTEYRLDRDRNRIDVGIDGLDIERLLDEIGYRAVEGTGTLSGLLPLVHSTHGITMDRGMLAAKPPGGWLRYEQVAGFSASPALAPVAQALSNFHYQVLQVEADYLENGDLVMQMQMRGRNPDLAENRPIHLNVNVTDNIPQLLHSLRAGRDIIDTVVGRAYPSSR